MSFFPRIAPQPELPLGYDNYEVFDNHRYAWEQGPDGMRHDPQRVCKLRVIAADTVAASVYRWRVILGP